MINRLSGFFSSQRSLLNSWELPLTGLLLIAGLAATASTLAATAQKQQQAVNATPVASTLRTVVPDQPTQAIAPNLAAPNRGVVAPQQQPTPGVNSTSVASNMGTLEPQPRTQAVEPSSVAVASNWRAVAPQQPAQAVDPASAVLPSELAAPQKPGNSADSTSGAVPSVKWNHKLHGGHKPIVAQAPTSDTSIPDGTYLYGQSSEPEQIGKEYILFEARQGKVIGAMYLPGSEYSCFYGSLDAKQMNLTVVNPYDQTAFSHTIARAQTSQVAAAGGQINLENTYDSLTYPHRVALEGYQQINKIGDNDQRLLSECRNNPKAQVENR